MYVELVRQIHGNQSENKELNYFKNSIISFKTYIHTYIKFIEINQKVKKNSIISFDIYIQTYVKFIEVNQKVRNSIISLNPYAAGG